MFKSLLFLLSLGSACAATMITTVNCPHTYSETGTMWAACTEMPGDNYYSSTAEVDISPHSISVATHAHGTSEAFFTATYDLWISGGQTVATFAPCLSTSALGSSSASASVGSWPYPTMVGCDSDRPSAYQITSPIWITLDAEVTLHDGRIDYGSANAGFYGFKFWDVDGNRLWNVTYTLTEITQIPEPANLTFSGLLLLAIAAALRNWKS